MHLTENEIVLSKCRGFVGKRKAANFFFVLSLLFVAIFAISVINPFEVTTRYISLIPLGFIPSTYLIWNLSAFEEIALALSALFLLISILCGLSYASYYSRNYLILTNKRIFVASKSARKNKTKSIELKKIEKVLYENKVLKLTTDISEIIIPKIQLASQTKSVIIHLLHTANPDLDFDNIDRFTISIDEEDELIRELDAERAEQERLALEAERELEGLNILVDQTHEDEVIAEVDALDSNEPLNLDLTTDHTDDVE